MKKGSNSFYLFGKQDASILFTAFLFIKSFFMKNVFFNNGLDTLVTVPLFCFTSQKMDKQFSRLSSLVEILLQRYRNPG